MFWKILALVLVVLLLAETGYIFAHPRQTNRFQPLSEYRGALALDTATGRMCRTMPAFPPKSAVELWLWSLSSDPKKSDESMTFFTQTLPTCWEIR
jgi:hypothetical protein